MCGHKVVKCVGDGEREAHRRWREVSIAEGESMTVWSGGVRVAEGESVSACSKNARDEMAMVSVR